MTGVTGCPPWSSGWSTWARPPRSCSGSRPASRSRRSSRTTSRRRRGRRAPRCTCWLPADAIRGVAPAAVRLRLYAGGGVARELVGRAGVSGGAGQAGFFGTELRPTSTASEERRCRCRGRRRAPRRGRSRSAASRSGRRPAARGRRQRSCYGHADPAAELGAERRQQQRDQACLSGTPASRTHRGWSQSIGRWPR